MRKGKAISHGHYVNGRETPEHYTWRAMLQRCANPNNKYYADYGGRGITYDPRWEKFENFLADMGERPCGLSLERRDNNLGYSKSNCYWATRSQQQKNKRTTRRWRQGSAVGTLTEWAAKLGISKELAFDRWKRWGTFKKGLTWEELPRAL